MGFMQRQVQHGKWLEVDTRNGMDIVPHDLVGDLPGLTQPGDELEWEHVGGEDRATILNAVSLYVGSISLDQHSDSGIVWLRLKEGWGARLSAPGFMDCTEWAIFDSEQEAKDYLEETYGDDEEEDDE